MAEEHRLIDDLRDWRVGHRQPRACRLARHPPGWLTKGRQEKEINIKYK